MNYEGNEEYFEKEIIKTTKLVDLVLEEHELKEDFLRSNSPDMGKFFQEVITLNQILTGLSSEDCGGFAEIAVEEKISRYYRHEVQKAALEENFEKREND